MLKSVISITTKVEGKANIFASNGKYYTRKIYNQNNEVKHICFDGYVYSFKMDDGLAFEINNEGRYKDVAESILGKFEAEETEVVVVEAEEIEESSEVYHEKYQMIKACIENNVPVFLVGPAGSGKNHTLEQIAWDLELDFYFTNSIQQEYKLTGFIDAGGNFHETEFYKAFTKGGLFFLDEMDASIPEVLVLLNAAIANRYFEFPNGKVTAHEDFRVVSAGNTTGNGADEQYTGRLVLDQATLDRFAIIEFDYSRRIELHLSKNNAELVDFIRDLRTQAKQKGIRATFSYRCITMITKLEGILKVEELLTIAVFKGMDKDTVNTFRPNGFTKYHEALKRVQA